MKNYSTDQELKVGSITAEFDYQDQIDRINERREIQRMLHSIPGTTLDAGTENILVETAGKSINHVHIQAREYFKQWVGRVVEIEDNDTFVAKVETLKSHSYETKIVRFNRTKVKMVNTEQFREGAVFYWTVGMFNRNKVMVKQSEVRFQMLTPPSQLLLNALEDDLGKVYDGISWLE